MSTTHQAKDAIAAEQAAAWNGRSGCAWIEAQETLDRMFLPFEEMLAGLIAPGSNESSLDVGCGTGTTTLAIARRLSVGGHAVGIDISEPMIAVAKARAGHEGSQASFIAADAQNHPFAPASFDAVVSRFGVMFFSDPARAFTNLRGALKSGAALHAIVWRGPADNPFMTAGERAAAPLLPQLPPRRPDGPGQFAFGDPQNVAGILGESGWKAIDIRPLDVECTVATEELERYMTRLGPVGQVLQDVDESTRQRVIAAVRAGYDPFVHGDQVRYTAACWLVQARA
jgi:SAM-dependent methyltransferase